MRLRVRLYFVKGLDTRLLAGRLIRIREDTPGVHVSRLGVIPKPHQPGGWSDLSSPKGGSVNDGVDTELCSVFYHRYWFYASVEDKSLGPGALLAKFDIANAYRAVPVHPDDRLLLGMKWRNETFVDEALPFGIRSAPKLFTAVADALLWVVGRRGVIHGMHYLDDFLVLGPPHSEECSHALSNSLQLCERVGFPVAPHKREGQSSRFSFLGILIDTEQLTLSLPPDKLARSPLLLGRAGGGVVAARPALLPPPPRKPLGGESVGGWGQGLPCTTAIPTLRRVACWCRYYAAPVAVYITSSSLR